MSPRRRRVSGVNAPSDRRFRRPDVRPGRRRWGQRLRRYAKTGTVTLVAVVSAAWLAGAVMSSTWLEVDRIVVRGNERLSTTAVEELVAGLRGQNVLDVDFAVYRRQLLESPWVRTVNLFRMLPSTVEIRLTERQPIAIARLDGQLFLVDSEGVIVDEHGPEYGDLDVPLVDGLVSSPEPGRPAVERGRVELARRFLDQLSGHVDLRRRVSLIDVTNESDLVALVDADPVFLHLGHDEFVERLETYLEIAPSLREQFSRIDYVDLRFGELVYVRSDGRIATTAGGH